ncbi:MazG nucleotide pyrophosphohydrolase domain-containing protein [Blautia sp. MSJ-19]|uniref:MazG nucleotide pyrophosphohydrolase domain-containing protein n=1 Tax=Blautia sp. MSJ-19 TaxID=2841517 RepID=UPI001C0EE93C|nr:MazG nucleotide pyrophosphohydrolase domain-containing protein [Blautia sp. MSJ-19]MBU5479641.1 nucleotide pyrophosphohydrolase [Blautia sp. MSJ-19]
MQTFDEFMGVVRLIREQCPWDSVQTHESLKKYLVEETREVLEGIDRLTEKQDSANLCEELGDVLFQIALHSVIAEQEGLFNIQDVIEGISEKMKFRHPKIFAPQDKSLSELSWEELKQKERALQEEKV